ncbi:hypothetical protein DRW07_05990 [Alteromonas sediminis]|uniref:Uncharacterized protein n=1 Tax=Alteromonas sediminis TaxID=2259342 RepID=A0A3N5Y1M4_9ALTE|nr:DUF6445 family protein [Alteromonas sediminis]RPJ67090.1 hypothetical protein DRW07_05990 [Alteromonas sediminis]
MSFKINRAAKPYFSYVGKEKSPVFILDNFLENLVPSLLQNIEQVEFETSPTYYPGIRAKLPEQYVLAVATAMLPVITKIYQIPQDYQVAFFDSYYSLVTLEPQELSVEQQFPHFDGTDQYRLALLHYLNPNGHGGTAFYRHDATHIERVDESNVNRYLSSISEFVNGHSAFSQGYVDGSHSEFTKIGEIPYAQNRLAIYPGNLLHSGVIHPKTDIDANPATGRLTANIFLNFTPPE